MGRSQQCYNFYKQNDWVFTFQFAMYYHKLTDYSIKTFKLNSEKYNKSYSIKGLQGYSKFIFYKNVY